ncbi:hypothetical protein [Paenibacillus hamazuiensis]|uniref:hypothetical protein n=1 Tax=Paenibacillus hamazuiensis TaxID=2936508 RepID=UPI0020101E23|nr:hypothetical protein [Paenibacillus hamazuiensis]
MYVNGQQLTEDDHFREHLEHGIPIQVYEQALHRDIGFIDDFTEHFIKINSVLYNRRLHTFISRPGY